MLHPVFDHGGDGSLLHLAIANGFPPQTYRPLVATLTDHFTVKTLVPRALWPDETPPESRRLTWEKTLAKDLIDGIQAHDLRDIVAVGHSFGGIATLLAAIALPDRFRAVILLDPTVLPQIGMWWMRAAQLLNADLGNPLAKGADKRRVEFDSRAAFYERYRSKRLFADWHNDAFQGYVDALVPTGDGDRVRLAWPREWEAFYFRTIYPRSWSELPRLRATGLPIMTVRGGTSDTLFPQAAKRMQRTLPAMAYREVAGHGHLFPQSAPDETAHIILDWLREINLVS